MHIGVLPGKLGGCLGYLSYVGQRRGFHYKCTFVCYLASSEVASATCPMFGSGGVFIISLFVTWPAQRLPRLLVLCSAVEGFSSSAMNVGLLHVLVAKNQKYYQASKKQ